MWRGGESVGIRKAETSSQSAGRAAGQQGGIKIITGKKMRGRRGSGRRPECDSPANHLGRGGGILTKNQKPRFRGADGFHFFPFQKLFPLSGGHRIHLFQGEGEAQHGGGTGSSIGASRATPYFPKRASAQAKHLFRRWTCFFSGGIARWDIRGGLRRRPRPRRRRGRTGNRRLAFFKAAGRGGGWGGADRKGEKKQGGGELSAGTAELAREEAGAGSALPGKRAGRGTFRAPQGREGLARAGGLPLHHFMLREVDIGDEVLGCQALRLRPIIVAPWFTTKERFFHGGREVRKPKAGGQNPRDHGAGPGENRGSGWPGRGLHSRKKGTNFLRLMEIRAGGGP